MGSQCRTCPHGPRVITGLVQAKEECSGVLRKIPLAAAGFEDERPHKRVWAAAKARTQVLPLPEP